jgi:hypothetical protein
VASFVLRKASKEAVRKKKKKNFEKRFGGLKTICYLCTPNRKRGTENKGAKQTKGPENKSFTRF